MGAVEMSCTEYLGYVGDHGFIFDIKCLCVAVEPLEDTGSVGGWNVGGGKL